MSIQIDLVELNRRVYQQAWPQCNPNKLLRLAQATANIGIAIEALNRNGTGESPIILKQIISSPVPDPCGFTSEVNGFHCKVGIELWRNGIYDASGELVLDDAPKLALGAKLRHRDNGWNGCAAFRGGDHWDAEVYPVDKTGISPQERPGYTRTNLGGLIERVLDLVP